MKSKVALLIPSAVLVGQSVWLRGLQLVQVCAAAGATMAESSDKQSRSDMVASQLVNERMMPYGCGFEGGECADVRARRCEGVTVVQQKDGGK